MATISRIVQVVDDLIKKHKTRNPFKLCEALGIHIHYKDLGSIKAYYFRQSRISNIVLNTRVSELMRRTLVAHELGHDRLHQGLALLKSVREIEISGMLEPAEYEATLFAAELLIEDKELLGILNDDDKSFFGVANELYVPAPLLDHKFRILKHKGYRISPLYIANGDFLKGDVEGCFGGDDFHIC